MMEAVPCLVQLRTNSFLVISEKYLRVVQKEEVVITVTVCFPQDGRVVYRKRLQNQFHKIKNKRRVYPDSFLPCVTK